MGWKVPLFEKNTMFLKWNLLLNIKDSVVHCLIIQSIMVEVELVLIN